MKCPGPVRRRSFLEIGALSLAGMGLTDLLRLEAEARAAGSRLADRDTNVIFIWLPGGPPHMEMYDMKPEAPSEYRGIFRPIRSNVPGMDVCELLPRHAKIADKFNLIRSCHHEFADHGGGHKRFMTGRAPAEPTGFVNDAPSAASIIASELGSHRPDGLPNVAVGTDSGRHGIDIFSLGSAWLGQENQPFVFHGDPSQRDFEVENLALNPKMADRLDDRMQLLEGFDSLRREMDTQGTMGAMDAFHEQAIRMLTSAKVRDAFDLSQESESIRQRYGMTRYGQRGLLARRLVEAGCRFVTMVWERPFQQMPKDCTYNWDSHAVNCDLNADLRWRLPSYDQALTALIEDVHERGMAENTMIICTGEFGRTPKMNQRTGSKSGKLQPGRDHWPKAMSMLVSGGGMQTGQVIGATNDKGEHPVDRLLTPNDLWATVYQHLGIDYRGHTYDQQDRPMPILPFGKPIEELQPRGIAA